MNYIFKHILMVCCMVTLMTIGHSTAWAQVVQPPKPVVLGEDSIKDLLNTCTTATASCKATGGVTLPGGTTTITCTFKDGNGKVLGTGSFPKGTNVTVAAQQIMAAMKDSTGGFCTTLTVTNTTLKKTVVCKKKGAMNEVDKDNQLLAAMYSFLVPISEAHAQELLIDEDCIMEESTGDGIEDGTEFTFTICSDSSACPATTGTLDMFQTIQ